MDPQIEAAGRAHDLAALREQGDEAATNYTMSELHEEWDTVVDGRKVQVRANEPSA